MTTPYIGYGNDQLRDQPAYTLDDVGRLVVCPNCGKMHPLVLCRTTDGKLSTMLALVKCSGSEFLVGVAGHLVSGVKPACSGSVDLSELNEKEP